MSPSLEEGLRSHLLAQIVGLRLYPDRLPQPHILPAVVYQRVSTVPSYVHSGDSCTDDVRIQITAFATQRIDADTWIGKIRTVLSGFRGNLGGVSVGRCLLLNQTSEYEPTVEYYISRQDYSFGVIGW